MTRALACLCLFATVALAEQPRPWANGVTQANQDSALALYREGNSFFEQSNHAQALAKYREALARWDHPAIRFNTAVALINLDQPLEAFEHLEAALRFGEAPFGSETYKQALLYRKLLSGQVAELEVTCDEPGAELTLDGEVLFTAPGKALRRLRPGAHQLVSKKAGFETLASAVQLAAGETRHEVVTLQRTVVAEVKLVRRFPLWLPWTVMGAGAVVALVGVPVMASAESSYERYDQDLSRVCPSGCPLASLPGSVLDLKQSAAAQNGAAIGLFSVGGAAVVTGVVLAVLNQPRPETPSAVTAQIVPFIGPAASGVMVGGAF